MKKRVKIARNGTITMLATDIVYGQRLEWSNVCPRPLYLSLMRPRCAFPYDKKQILPLIIWISGGGFSEQDRNAWMPELAWFVKKGYAVASVDYSVSYRTRFPMAVEDIKLAIRYLKAFGSGYNLDTNRIAIMGESAGGYLASFCGLTGQEKKYDIGAYDTYTSEVQAVIPWYPAVRMSEIQIDLNRITVPYDIREYPDLTKLINLDKKVPPFLILHGTIDSQVPLSQGELLHDELEKAGMAVEMVIFEDSEHTDPIFIEDETKQIILDFLNRKLNKTELKY
jgi:acetyl esterase/lipase